MTVSSDNTANLWDVPLLQQSAPERLPQLAEAVRGITVGRKCRRIHFLHAACMSWGTANGVPIGRFVFHQTGQAPSDMSIHFGSDVRDWQVTPKQQPVGTDPATIVWRGTNSAAKSLQLFRSTWENPHPESVVQTIDHVSGMSTAAPFLVAITVEPAGAK